MQSAYHDYRIVPVVEGLVRPWSIAFLPDGEMLVTEKAGTLRVVRDGLLLPEPVKGVPEVISAGQGGLLDVVPHPDFEDNRLLYLSYSKPDETERGTTAVIRGRYRERRSDGHRGDLPCGIGRARALRVPSRLRRTGAPLHQRRRSSGLDGPADLAIEVVSPASRLRDRGEKLAEYEMGGVREYWVIDPEEQRADFYVLAADGRYERRRTGEDGIYPSEVLTGFRLRESWLWQQPLPKALSALKELGVV